VTFHVEISSSFRHARGFNLGEEELLRTIVAPWLAGRRIALGDREWEPRDSALRILEGSELKPPDLAFGQGWANAERSAEDVTRSVLEKAPRPAAPDAFVVEADLPEAAVGEMLAGHEARPLAWSEARGRLDGRDPGVAAVILVVRRSEPEAR
jgi:hypothetical protein